MPVDCSQDGALRRSGRSKNGSGRRAGYRPGMRVHPHPPADEPPLASQIFRAFLAAANMPQRSLFETWWAGVLTLDSQLPLGSTA
jgi:hypothetical protein